MPKLWGKPAHRGTISHAILLLKLGAIVTCILQVRLAQVSHVHTNQDHTKNGYVLKSPMLVAVPKKGRQSRSSRACPWVRTKD